MFRGRSAYIWALCGIALLSFGLNFLLIGNNGYGNSYYAAAIRSMTQSLRNFFFVSFDPAGVVSVDKPPVGLWVQAVFVLIFGYRGWAMLLPQALSGALGALMMYVLVAKRSSRPAGLIAALAFALSPAVVVASRNNTMDMQLVLVLLCAAWCLFRALERQKPLWLWLAAVLVGIGFNIKMLQAYMILPAMALVYLFFSAEPVGRRLAKSALCAALIGAVSLSWVLAVDLTPAKERPYVGSSVDNSEMELIVGHNGLERLFGRTAIKSSDPGLRMAPNPLAGDAQGLLKTLRLYGLPALPELEDGATLGEASTGSKATGSKTTGLQTTNAQTANAQAANAQTTKLRQAAAALETVESARGGAGNNIGAPGLFRLFNKNMYGQISWLLVFAAFCAAASIRRDGLKKRAPSQGLVWFFLIYLVSTVGFFSFAKFFHRYYLCMIAPGIAGLAGIGSIEMFRSFRDREGRRQWLLPGSLLATAAVAAIEVYAFAQVRAWLIPVILAFTLGALPLMLLARRSNGKVLLRLAAGCMGAALLAGPLCWSLTATLYTPENSTMPYAGPELAFKAVTPGMTANQEEFTGAKGEMLALEQYLVKHYRPGSFMVVAQRANDVAEFIVDTGLPAVAYGGFLGSDNAMAPLRFAELVEQGTIKYFLIFPGGFQTVIADYVKRAARLVPASEYGGTGESGAQLYAFPPRARAS
ncbi:MAG: glycosyltransferase family 39 protein [Bacillota bacterium]